DDQVPPTLVGPAHRLHALLGAAEGGQGGALGGGVDARNHLLLDGGHHPEQRSRPQEIADPPPRHGVLLGEGVDRHRAVREAGERAEAHVADVAVDERLVGLVGNEEEIVTEGQVGDGVEEIARVHATGRVGGGVDEQGAGAWRDGGGDGGGGGEVAVLGIGGNVHGHATGQDDLAHEVGVARVGHDDL